MIGFCRLLVMGMLLTTPALASTPTPASHEVPASADHNAGAAHEETGAHQDEHAEHKPVYSVDADADGISNWRDADAGEHYVLSSIMWHFLNLALYLGVLAWFAWPPIKAMLAARHDTIHQDLTTAHAELTEARKRHDDAISRLEKLEHEIAAIATRADADALAEVARIDARAKEADARLRASVAQHIRDESDRARRAVRAEAVELAIELAEGVLQKQFQTADQMALATAFLATVRASEGEADA